MYEVRQTVKGVKRWALAASPGAAAAAPRARAQHVGRRVFVVDNGGVPFVVELSSGAARPGVARVLRQRRDASDALDGLDVHDRARRAELLELLEPWRAFTYRRAWVGLDPRERKRGRVDRPTGRAWWEGGSAVLLETTAGAVVYIGSEVYQFRAPDRILGFASRMGNNDVPYPWAVGEQNTYLLLERTFIPNALLASLSRAAPAGADPYDILYGLDSSARREHARAHRLWGFKRLHERL